jgi:hypothetical protein
MSYLNGVTRHAKHRIKHRLGTKNKQIADEAHKNGIPIKYFNGSFRRYLDMERRRKGTDVYLRIYKNKIFMFVKPDGLLVTIMNVPQIHFKSLVAQMKKISKMEEAENE